MSYLSQSNPTSAIIPTINNDISKGHVVGSIIIYTGASPRVAYICKDSSIGAAVWSAIGAASLIAIMVSVHADIAVVLSPLSSPANATTSNGIIGGP